MVAGADQVTLSHHTFLPVAIIASAAIISSGTIIVASRTIVGSTAIIASVAIKSPRAIVGSGTVISARAVVSPGAIVTRPVIRAGEQAAKDHAGRETADDRATIVVPVVVAVPAVITPITDVDDIRIFNGVGCVDAWKSLCRRYAHESCDQRNNHDREFSHPLLSCFSPSPFPVSIYKDT
jgi:hypothetical protein